MRVEILDFKITDEPNVSLSRKPDVDRCAEQAHKALLEGNGKLAEMKLRRASELEPDAPDLWNNLAMALLMQGRQTDHDLIAETVLALLTLTMHDESEFGCRAWKNLNWSTMDQLHELGYIDDPKNKSKSVFLTADGMQRARELFDKLFAKSDKTCKG